MKELPVWYKWLETENWFNYPDFYARAAEDPFRVYVEVGAWKGHSIRFLANALLKTEKQFELYAVDLWDRLHTNSKIYEQYWNQIPYLYDIYDTNLKNAGVRGHVFDLKHPSDAAADLFKDKAVDFVFIDASHDEESVKKDIRAWLPKVRKGGVISGHDFHTDGVTAAVNEVLRGEQVMHSSESDVWVYQKRV